MGLFDNDGSGIYDRAFDINGDGKLDLDEEYFAHKMFQEQLEKNKKKWNINSNNNSKNK